MSLITKTFYEILLSSYRGVVLANYFSSLLKNNQISKFKRGTFPPKNGIRLVNIHIQIYTFMTFLITKSHKIL